MKFLKTATLTVGLMVALAAPAAAQGYPGTAGLTCTPATAARGEMITMVATGYPSGAEVTFEIGGVVVGTALSNSDGVATLSAAFPNGVAEGAVPCVSTGIDANGGALVLTSSITVLHGDVGPSTVPPPASTATLPVTGSETRPLVQVAIGVVALGGLLLLVSRHKRATAAQIDTTV